MRDYVTGLLYGLMLVLPGWAVASPLSDCLLEFRIRTPACARQIVAFESSHLEVRDISGSVGIDPDLIRAVIAVESGYSDLKRADRGGIGPMQVTSIAAREMGINDPTYLLSDTVNIRTGTLYLRKMMQRFGDWRLALAAYNAGPGAVQKHRGIPPYRETQDYVRQVLWWYLTLKSV